MGFTDWGYVDAFDSGVVDARERYIPNEVELPSSLRVQLEELPERLDSMGRVEKSVLESAA